MKPLTRVGTTRHTVNRITTPGTYILQDLSYEIFTRFYTNLVFGLPTGLVFVPSSVTINPIFVSESICPLLLYTGKMFL